MQRENWKAIESSQAVSLDDSDRTLLDKVQSHLALNDAEFLHFLILVGKVSRCAALLGAARLPKQ